MQDVDYPALYLSADQASNEHQSRFLGLIKGEYAVLILAAVFSLSFLSHVAFAAIYALLFFAGLSILLVRAFWKPEQAWYRSRALAESVKTLTWRYVMHSSHVIAKGEWCLVVRTNATSDDYSYSRDAAKPMLDAAWAKLKVLYEGLGMSPPGN